MFGAIVCFFRVLAICMTSFCIQNHIFVVVGQPWNCKYQSQRQIGPTCNTKNHCRFSYLSKHISCCFVMRHILLCIQTISLKGKLGTLVGQSQKKKGMRPTSSSNPLLHAMMALPWPILFTTSNQAITQMVCQTNQQNQGWSPNLVSPRPQLGHAHSCASGYGLPHMA